MNKILVILSLCITSLSILGLVSAQSDMPTQFCTRWSPKQISNLSAVQTFIQTYGQQIDQSFTSNTDLLNLATTARQDLLSQLSLIQACDQNQTYTQSYATLVDLVKVYV